MRIKCQCYMVSFLLRIFSYTGCVIKSGLICLKDDLLIIANCHFRDVHSNKNVSIGSDFICDLSLRSSGHGSVAKKINKTVFVRQHLSSKTILETGYLNILHVILGLILTTHFRYPRNLDQFGFSKNMQ